MYVRLGCAQRAESMFDLYIKSARHLWLVVCPAICLLDSKSEFSFHLYLALWCNLTFRQSGVWATGLPIAAQRCWQELDGNSWRSRKGLRALSGRSTERTSPSSTWIPSRAYIDSTTSSTSWSNIMLYRLLMPSADVCFAWGVTPSVKMASSRSPNGKRLTTGRLLSILMTWGNVRVSYSSCLK
jgi:hypothetical protein